LADKYLTEKSQREKAEADAKTAAAELKREKAENKSWTILLVGIILLIILAGVVGWQRNRSRITKLKFAAQEQKRLEEQRQLLKDAEWKAVRLSMETGEQERQRIAKNLHDTLGSKLSVIQMNFQSLQRNLQFNDEKYQVRYKEGIQHLDDACQEVRRISRHMAQGDLSHFGLQLALEKYAQQVQESSEMEVHFAVKGTPKKLTPQQETEIYAILGTAIENVIRHAKAENINLELTFQPERLVITLTDDGQGFDKAKAKEKKGLGIKNIAERAERIGAQHHIITHPGEGTTLELVIPIEKAEK
jgi:signal transduction histidine kinase